MEMILQRYGQQTWDLVYRDYTERLWGRDDIGLWSFVSEEPGRIPKTSEYLTANSRVAYPCNGWRHVVEHIWPFAWKHGRVDVEHVDADVIIDTSPKLYGGAWRQASFSAHADPALPCIVEYRTKGPSHLRTINQSRIAGCYMPDQLSINVSQYSTIDHDGPLYATACHTSNAYPMPGLDAEIENVWQSLPDNVWPFGRGGLHVYDSMANVVSGAMRLMDMIKGQEHGPTIEELHELRAIVGGWQ
jgi:hypothetical protein